MHSFLVTVLPFALWLLTIAEAAFLFLFLKGFKNTGKALFLLSGLMTIGLVCDGFILALGTVMPEGGLLKTLSRLRFVSHGALIPLLFPICACALELKGAVKKAVWAFTAVLIALGIAEGCVTVLESRAVAGMIRYASADSTPAWAAKASSLLSYGTVVPLIIAGVWVWIKQKTPCLFLSGFLMFAFAALGPATGNFDLIFFISMFGEMCMVIFLYLYANKNRV